VVPAEEAGKDCAAVAVMREAVSADNRAPCRNEIIVSCPSSKTLGIIRLMVVKKMPSPKALKIGIWSD